MLRDSNEGGNDRAILEHYTMDDIDIPSLERYRMLFNINNPEHVWKDLSHQEFLKQLGGYAQDRTTGIEGLTIAGLLMFGKGLPIRDRFDNLRMDYIDKTNLIGEQRYSDRLTYDGTWENNLLNFIRIVLPRLTRDPPRPFAMEGMERKDDTLQHKAVREAVTNAIIHADFMLNGILRIEKYDDRFVLTNPGLLKLPLEQIYAGGESKARNQRIQSMLRMIGYGENLGSGFPMILNAWNEKHWLKPTLTEQPELLQVKLTLFVQTDDIPQEPTGRSTVEAMEKSSEKSSGKSSEKIIDIIKQSPKITAKEISIVLGISSRGVEKQIKNLREQGILRRIGPDKGGHWEVVE
jgi:predicted HTH transcriptional regulator